MVVWFNQSFDKMMNENREYSRSNVRGLFALTRGRWTVHFGSAVLDLFKDDKDPHKL